MKWNAAGVYHELMKAQLLVAVLVCGNVVVHAQTQPPASWLDKPFVIWNKAGASVPMAPLTRANRDRILATCTESLLTSTPAERALSDAGWIPFLNFDQKIEQGDIEIVGGMAGVDGMCRPTGYNLFVFAGGRFAGTLSPVPMISRTDASSGAVRIIGPENISAEFVRYTEKDALCCPSSRVTVRFRINRLSAPVVAPTELRTTRSTK